MVTVMQVATSSFLSVNNLQALAGGVGTEKNVDNHAMYSAQWEHNLSPC